MMDADDLTPGAGVMDLSILNIDVFQMRVLVKLLDGAKKSQDARNTVHVFNIGDANLLAVKALEDGFKLLEKGNRHAAQAQIFNAFWLNYCTNEDYSGPARCFINPPPVVMAQGADQVTMVTHDGCGKIGQLLDFRNFIPPPVLGMMLNSIQGEETGFFNEVVVFCDGRLDHATANKVVSVLGAHILPQTTVFIFEVPNNDNGLWLSLFDSKPSDDVGNILSSIQDQTQLQLERIEVKNTGPRSSIYFGVVA